MRTMDKSELVFLNYKPAKLNNAVAADTVPTLVPAEVMSALTEGDDAPFYKVESIQYPVKGTGGVYTETFFDSFVGVMNARPIPGSKRGHEFSSRPRSDVYTVGGRLDKNGDGTGTVHFKVYFPKVGDESDNAGLIRDAKAGIVNFSLVTMPEYNVTRDADGREVYNFTKSLGYERNDAVEYGAGAMKQTVNGGRVSNADEKNSAGVRKAKALIAAGNIDKDSRWAFSAADGDALLGDSGDDWEEYESWFLVQDSAAPEETKERYKYPFGKNGRVYRSALRAIASRASAQNLPEISDLASSLIEEIDKKGNTRMTKEDILAWLKVNSAVPLAEIAGAMGLEDPIAKNAEQAKELEALKVENAALKADLAKVEDDRRKNALDAEFGTEGDLRTYASKILGAVPMANMEAALTEFKKDSIALKLAGNKADVWAGVSEIKTARDPFADMRR